MSATDINNCVRKGIKMKTDFAKKPTVFIWLCAIVYFTSYLTRNSYNSVIAEVTTSLKTTADATGLIGTCAFLTYGIGQLICGVLGDRFSPRYLILSGIAGTAVCNILMPFSGGNTAFMTVLWGINGFAQAMFWPPLVRLMSDHLSTADYNRAVVAVTTASSVGNILLYLISPVCISLLGWNLVFYITGGIGAAMLAAWFFGTRTLPKKEIEEKNTPLESKTEKTSLWNIVTASGMVLILIAIVLQGMLRDGLATWMPSLISDTFGLSNAVSILTAVALPVFAIIGIKATARFQDRIKNELLCAAILYGIGFACTLLIIPLMSVSFIASVALMSLVTAAMHGVNLLLISRVPIYFARYGRISAVSGLLNAFTYVGSAASTYGFAVFSEHYGWYFTVGSWAVITAIGGLICLVNVRKWKRFTN